MLARESRRFRTHSESSNLRSEDRFHVDDDRVRACRDQVIGVAIGAVKKMDDARQCARSREILPHFALVGARRIVDVLGPSILTAIENPERAKSTRRIPLAQPIQKSIPGRFDAETPWLVD